MNDEKYKQLQSQLAVIRNQYHQYKQQVDYEQWSLYYEEHLNNLYNIYGRYSQDNTLKPLSYDDFTYLCYQATQPIYDYQSRSYRRYLL